MNPKKIYGREGEDVTLISDCGPVLIVEGSGGIRFPVRRELVEIKPIKAGEQINLFQ